MYHIVHFKASEYDEEESVDIVPRNWIFQEKGELFTKWPSNPKSVKSFVMKNKEPDDGYLKCPITIWKNRIFDTYDVARKSLPKAERDSDRSSADEAGILKKRRIVPPPKFIDQVKPPAKERIVPAVMDDEATLSLVDHGVSMSEDTDSDNELHFTPPLNKTAKSNPPTRRIKPPQFQTQSEDNNSDSSRASTSGTPVMSISLREPPRQTALFQNTAEGDIVKKLDQLITNMAAISMEQATLRLTVGNLDKKLDTLLNAQGRSNRSEELEDLLKWPLRDVEEFQQHESKLSQCTQAQDQFKKQLDSYGGHDLQMKVNRMMLCVFLPPLAVKYTHFGLSRKGKECFNATFTAKIMKRVLIGRKFQEAEIDSAFVEYFRRSGERLKAFQRKERNNDLADDVAEPSDQDEA